MNLITFLTKSIFNIIALLFILGILFQFLFVIFSALAIPVFNSFRVLEAFSKMKFNLPKDGYKRLFANLAGGLITMAILQAIGTYMKMNPPKDPVLWVMNFIAFIAQPSNINTSTSIIVVACVIILIIISKNTNDDDNDKLWFDKFLPLKVPKLIS